MNRQHRMTRWWLLLVLMTAFVATAATQPMSMGLRFTGVADANGICALGGLLPAHTDVAVPCALDHDEGTPLTASVETGSLDVQGWVIRATGSRVIVGLRNSAGRPIDMNTARIRLGRITPATPSGHGRGTDAAHEACVLDAIAQHGDAITCGDDETETPAAVTAGVD